MYKEEQTRMKRFNELLSKEKDSKWREEVEKRQLNKDWFKKSAKIALKLNRTLRDQNLTQKSLAEILYGRLCIGGDGSGQGHCQSRAFRKACDCGA